MRKAISRGTHKTLCWQKDKLFYQILYPHYKYPHYQWNVRIAFQRENPSKYTWELEIVIPTIIYTFPLSFPLLLPLHLYILERFLTQTLTTPDLSVESSFGAFGKWKHKLVWNTRARLHSKLKITARLLLP